MENYQKVYAHNEEDDEVYGLKSYWTSSQTVEFEDGQTLEDYKSALESEIDAKADTIDYDLDAGKIYLYSNNVKIAEEPLRIRTAPSVGLNDVEHFNIRLVDGKTCIKWDDPSDVEFGGLSLCEWAGTKIIRKAGSIPESPTDGSVVLNSTTRDQYSSTFYYDANVPGGTYQYYRLFPYDTDGKYYGETCGVIYKEVTLESVTIPSVSGMYTYTGSSISPTFDNYDSTKMTIGGDSFGINAGTYTTTFSLREGYKWNDDTVGDKIVTWNIGKATVTPPTISGTLTYTGQSQSPTVNGYNSTAMTKSGDESGTDAGMYTLVVSLSNTNNYQFSGTNDTSISLDWSIGKASMDVPTAGSLTYNGSEQLPTWTGYDNSKMTIGGVTSATNAGSYMATFTPGSNYEWTDNTTVAKNVEWSIEKASGFVELSDAEIDVSYGGTTTITVVRASGTVIVVPSDIQKADASISGDTITITGVDESTTSCRVNVAESTNYLATYTTIAITVGAPPMWKSTMVPFANENRQPIVEYNGEMHYTNGNKHYIWDGAEWRLGSYLSYNAKNESLVVYNNELHRLGGNNTNHYKYNGSEWISVGTTPLSDGLAVVYNECLYLFGYRYGYHYKWNGSSWEKLANAPYVINYMSNAIVWNGELHILGGSEGTKHYSWDGSTWTVCTALPYAFSYGSVAIIDNAIHIFGGNSSTNCRKHYYYNGTSWIQEPDICVDQGSAGKIITYKGSCYMIGGANANNLEPTMVRKFNADFSSYDVLSVVLPYSGATAQAKTTTVHNNIIHIVLGNKNHYTFDGNTLTQVSTFPISNCEGRIVSYHNALHYICVASSTKYHYKWENNEWVNVGTPPVTITRYGGVFVYNDKIYAINAADGTFYSWNGTSWTQETTGPSFSYGCSVLFDNKFYTFTPASNAISYRYWDGNTWSTSENISTTSMTSAVVLNGNLYLISTDSTNHTNMYRYTGEQWIVNNNLSGYPLFDSRVSQSSVVEYNNKLYMFGGNSSGIYNVIGVYK